ncbi:DUF5798 family protein [Salarchaeum japonicum]|uniref:Uncharacterized protein n=1 Tax=Salarchaeum japonicum TaxID=555573 RepID=A0AAV3SXL6_9EURY|nr:DUF5798 family protein [Salarchaeum japonicum]
MGLGGTAKKVQKLADVADSLQARVKSIREDVEQTQETVIDTNERVEALEREVARQGEVLDAIATELDVDTGESDGDDNA